MVGGDVGGASGLVPVDWAVAFLGVDGSVGGLAFGDIDWVDGGFAVQRVCGFTVFLVIDGSPVC